MYIIEISEPDLGVGLGYHLNDFSAPELENPNFYHRNANLMFFWEAPKSIYSTLMGFNDCKWNVPNTNSYKMVIETNHSLQLISVANRGNPKETKVYIPYIYQGREKERERERENYWAK